MALTRSERGDLMVQIEDTYKELGQCSPGFDLLETLSDQQLQAELYGRQRDLLQKQLEN